MNEEVQLLHRNAEELETIEGLFAEEMPDLWLRYLMLRKQHRRLISEVQHALRQSGRTGTVTVDDHTFKVARPQKTVVRVLGVVHKAQEEEDIEALIEHGFLSFAANPGLFDRLPENLQRKYKEFVSQETGSVRVTVPGALKNAGR